MAKKKSALTFSDLVLFGKPLEDAAVKAALAKSSDVEHDTSFKDGQYASSKASGYSLWVKRKKGVTTLFLYSEGHEEYRGFAALPHGLTFGGQTALRKAMGSPDEERSLYDGWIRDGLLFKAYYASPPTSVRYYVVAPA